MTGINSTLINSENKENIVNSLNDSSLKLLELLNVNHGTLYTITSGVGKDKFERVEQYAHITIKVDDLNKVAQGMASLASIISLNPSFRSEKTN